MTDHEMLDIRREGAVCSLRLQRPEKLNALDESLLDAMSRALEDLADRDDFRVLVLEGEGRAFIAGADIEAMLEMSPQQGEAFARKGHELLERIETFATPVLAAVDGFALGGGLEVALACDLIYASGRAQFGLPEVRLGIIPGFGGTQRLARFVGWQRARELVYTANRIDAERAESIGLVCECIDVDVFDERIDEIADSIASRGPLALRAAKRAMRAGEDLDLEEGLAVERNEFRRLFETDDRVEGMEAFVDGRPPAFEEQ